MASGSSYKLIGKKLVDDNFPLTLYRNDDSGGRIVVVDHDNNMINLQISFVTAAEDNSGTPHALEHMIFHGSKRHPAYDILDRLGLLSNGSVSGQTYENNTAYRFQSANCDNFYKFLTVYLDHIFNPLLTEISYALDVHHINGNNEDSGAVHSEMSHNRFSTTRKFNEIMYGRESPLSLSSGGIPAEISSNLSLEKIRNYHKKYYKPDNMVITVVGIVSHERILEIIEGFERTNNLKKSGFVRPDFSPQIPFTKRFKKVNVPSDTGEIFITWKVHQKNKYNKHMRFLLTKYLTLHGNSSLKEFLFTNYWKKIYKKLSIYHFGDFIGFQFKNVNSKYFKRRNKSLFKKTLLDMIKNHKFDIKMMRDTILNLITEYFDRNQNKDTVDHIFDEIRDYQSLSDKISPDNDDLDEICQEYIKEFRAALNHDETYWKEMIKDLFTDEFVLLYFIPSKELIKKEKNKKQKRIQKRKKKLGEEGLKKCQERLYNLWKSSNEFRSFDRRLLDEFIDNDKIHFDKGVSAKRSIIYDKIPIITHRVDSEMIKTILTIDLKDISGEYDFVMLLYYLQIYINFDSLPDKHDDYITSNKVIINYNHLCIEITSTKYNIEKILDWYDHYLNQVKFSEEMVRVLLIYLDSNFFDELIRHLDCPCYTPCKTIDVFDFNTIYLQHQHFNPYLRRFACDNDHVFIEKLIDKLNAFKDIIHRSKRNFHIIGDIGEIDVNSLDLDRLSTTSSNKLITNSFSKNNAFKLYPGKTYCILSDDYKDIVIKQWLEEKIDKKSIHRIAIEMVNHYLTVAWNYFKRNVLKIEQPTLTYESEYGVTLTTTFGSYDKFKDFIFNHILNPDKINHDSFIQAKGNLIRFITRKERSADVNGDNSFKQFMEGFDLNQNKNFTDITMIQALTVEDMIKTVKEYCVELFNEKRITRIVVGQPEDHDKIKNKFLNIEFKTVKS